MDKKRQSQTAFTILAMLAASHMMNDTLQSIIPSVYPLLSESLALDFGQIGIITFVFQLSASIFQPVIGLVTDRKPQPNSLPIGMAFTMIGIFSLAFANSFSLVLVAVFLTGLGSSIFHPEASRLAYMASGGKHGLAQSLFQVGGNFGGSLGPLLAAFLITPYGQQNIAWFTIVALISIVVMSFISKWYRANLYRLKPATSSAEESGISSIKQKENGIPRKTVIKALSILFILIFSKYVYLASLTSYYTFYLMDKFGVSVKSSQLFLFAFLFASAVGTLFGGPIGDKIGRKYVIWISILGAAPFALAMPYVGLVGTCLLSIVIGLILSSAFSAILVYAQELLPGKVGLIGGLFFGLAFGIAGIASAVFGKVADIYGIQFVYKMCAFLPLLGLVTIFLPNVKRHKTSE